MKKSLEDKYKDYNDYYGIVEELLKNEMVQQLDRYPQHINSTRLDHSIYVSYKSYIVAKRLNFDYITAARAGLLHDLFLYDWKEEKQPEGSHAYAHPRVALRNAKEITALNIKEADAIVKHMWPMTMAMPIYKESYVVTFMDKYCACMEFVSGIGSNLSLSLKNFNSVLFFIKRRIIFEGL